MKAPKSSAPRTLAPAGTHIARVIGYIYVGTVKTEWKGEEKWVPKIRISWELPTKTHSFKEGEPAKPFVVSKEFSFSMGGKSKLRPIVEGIIGTSLTDEEAYSFDIENILGKPCLLSITHEEGKNGKYISINSASQLVEGLTCPAQVTPTKVLSYEKWDQAYFDSLPSFIKDVIVTSKEYINMKGVSGVEEINAEDIPFN